MTTQISPAALPRRLLLIKSKIANQPGYYLHNGRWHAVQEYGAAPKSAPVASHPHAAGNFVPKAHFSDAQWDQLKLPADNVNAASYNRQLDRLRQMADSGNVTGIVGASFGTNTYGKKLAIIANKLLEMYGAEHRVTPGQKAGAHAAVQAVGKPASAPQMDLFGDDKPTDQGHAEGDKWVMPLDAAVKEHKELIQAAETPSKADDREQLADQKQELARMEAAKPAAPSLSMPAFQEGKTTTGVVDYYEGQARKIMAMAAAGDMDGLARMKADGLKPNSKGKISNTWAGKTANSKLLMALHAQAMGGGVVTDTVTEKPAAAVHPEGPKEGERNADGLIFRDGRWRREDDHTAKRAAQAAKLRAVADNLAAKAAEAQGRDRNTNTARRARMAGSAISAALADEAMAKTLHNLASAIESGEAKHLAGLTSKAQVQALQEALHDGMYASDKGLTYSQQQARKGRDVTAEDIKNARLPEIRFGQSGSSKIKVLEALKGKRGSKALADGIRNGGDMLTPDQVRGLEAAIGKKEASLQLGWYNIEKASVLSRLARMGITTDNDLRLALTEFVMFRAGKKAEDPVAKLERELVGQKVGVDFFPTPKALAARMADLAGIKPGMKVLEPSAGSGNLADAAKAAGGEVDAVEVSDKLRELLQAKGHKLAGRDFDQFEAAGQYDAVIMNPPFSNRQDAAHIQRAFDMLKPGGKLVAIAGEGVFFGSDKRAEAFRAWLDARGAEVEKLPAGTFEDKSLLATTGANARLIVMEKPAASESGRFKTTEDVNAVPMVHATTGDAAKASILESGFHLSHNSMYGMGVYFSNKDLSQAGGKYKTSLQVTLRPHKQLVLSSDLDVPAALREVTGLPQGALGGNAAREAFLAAGIGSLRFPVDDDEIYTLVLDPALIVTEKPESAASQPAGPREGDRNADGLVFRGGRWRRDGDAGRLAEPRQVLITQLDQQAHAAATSPHNDTPAPTPAQVEAGNYKKGHISVHGLDITVENPRGSVRSGKRPDGTIWSHTMSDHYGYIKRTTGADGEHIDVYVGDNHDSDKVFVVDQVNAAGEFDEHKVMLGFGSKDEAVAAYSSNFDKGWKVGPVTELSVEDFKSWLDQGETGRPLKMKDDGPQDGDTKPGENGGTLVFRDGRWHKQGDEPLALDDGMSDDPASPNYRFRDTGEIAGSRKEEAASRIKQAARDGQRLRATDIDWQEIEKNPREARELIKKSNLFGQVDWDGLKAGGMSPAAGFLVDRVYASIPAEPDRDSPQKRQDYALALETIRDRLERCKTPDEVTGVLAEIRDEMDGAMLSASESEEYKAAQAKASDLRQKARDAREVLDGYYKAFQMAEFAVNNITGEQEKRARRGWKPDPALDDQLEQAQEEKAAAEKVWREYKDQHPELAVKERAYPGGGRSYRNDLEHEAYTASLRADEILTAAKARNLRDNPVTRAWLTLGPRFMGVVNWRSYKGSDSFSGHVSNAKRGQIKDWSWAEKGEVSVKKATKRAVAFQLKVAENFQRKGGREVSADSTLALKSMFGLREVQSGNWVLNDPGSAAFHVQRAAEAFADLADLIGVPDADVSVHGRLAMAFGARGRGNAGYQGAARAHYEPVQRVINLTKMGGGGALAHEWFHALDNLVLEAEGAGESGKDVHLTEQPTLLPAGELRDAFVELRQAMTSGDVRGWMEVEYSAQDLKLAQHNVKPGSSANAARIILNAKDATEAVAGVRDYFDTLYSRREPSKREAKNRQDWLRIAAAYHDKNADGAKLQLQAGRKGSSFMNEAQLLDAGSKRGYWSEVHEMASRAFQSWVEDKLAAQGRKNDYLSCFADNRYYVDPILGSTKPFPEGEERERINAAFDKLMGVLAKRGTLAKAMALLAG